MTKKTFFLFLKWIIVCYFSLSYALAQFSRIELKTSDKISEISNKVTFFKDTIGQSTIQEILKPKIQTQFKKSHKSILNFELSEDWYWIKIELNNQTSISKWLLEVAEAKIEVIDLWYQDKNGKWQTIKNGYALPISQKFMHHYFQIFPLYFYQNQATFYLHAKGNLNPIPLKIITESEFNYYHLQKNLVYGIYYGLLLFIILNNVAFGLLIQNRTFLLYAGVVMGYAVGSALISGYIKLITDANILMTIAFTTFMLGTISIFYIKQFLNISNKYWEGKVLNIDLVFMQLFFWLTFFAQPTQALLTAQTVALLHHIVVLIIAISSIRREKQFAIYYLIGFIFLTIFIALEIIYSNTGSPAYFYLTHIEWGYLLEILVLAFALNLRFFVERRQLRIAKDLAQKEALNQALENAKLVTEQNQILEQKVEERTQALKQVNEELAIQEKETQSQNEELKAVQEELRQNMEEYKTLNEHLEQIVNERTLELQNTVKELTQQNQDLEQFSYIVSHNMRAPVARIIGLLNLYNREVLDTEFNRQLLTYLDQSAQNLDVIIRDLTNIITTRNRLDKVREYVDLEELSYTVMDALQDEINKSQAQIHLEFSDDLKHIHSVKGHLQSILYNLLSNAIKYKSPNRIPVITIGTKLLENQVMIYIQDNGLGIDMAKTNPYKIFGLYQRLHTHVEGKGLGLYLVKSEVEALQGKIEVESKLDVGSIFKIYFPLES